MMKAGTRVEHDTLGSLPIPTTALYGVHSARAVTNFPFGRLKLGDVHDLVESFACIKHAAAAANVKLGVLDPSIASAIVEACKAMRRGELDHQLCVPLLEGSGGTSINMCVNEVIANCAIIGLGGVPGEYARVHPNDHVNRSQSTNDVVPSAIKLASIALAKGTIEALALLAEACEKQAEELNDAVKLGRTCLQDAQPISMGQVFGGFAAFARRGAVQLQQRSDALLALPLGGTAIGTGFGSPAGYAALVYQELRAICGVEVRPADNAFDAMANSDEFVRLSGELNAIAGGLGKIANDLMLLSSGPNGGIGEIRLQPLQAGSSIMPGKVNPVVPMAVRQVAHKVAGLHATVAAASADGMLEINHYEPVIADALIEALELTRCAALCLAEKCILSLQADRDRMRKLLFASSAPATAIAADLGYDATADLVREADKLGVPFVNLIEERGIMTRRQIEDVVALSVSRASSEGTSRERVS